MMKRVLAVLLTVSMVFGNTSFLYAAEAGESSSAESTAEEIVADDTSEDDIPETMPDEIADGESVVDQVDETEEPAPEENTETANTEDTEDPVTCGPDITWALTGTDHDLTLTISGSGKMNDYAAESETPWASEKTKIKKIIVEEGITGLGSYAFCSLNNLTEVSLPDSVTSIGDGAFSESPCVLIVTAGSYAEKYAINNSIPYKSFCKAHTWNTEYTVDREASCTEEGSESIHCSICDEKKEGSERAIDKLEHTFGAWTLTKEPTATEPGIEERSCTLCGETEQREYWEGYDITYVLNGGTNHAENPNSYYKKALITLKNPTKAGYTFKGWYTDKKFKKKVTTVSGGNKTVYAKWTVNKYNITFNGNGSTSGKMKKMSGIAYNASKTLTGNAFKRTGYRFTGWNTKKDGSGTSYTNRQTVTKLSETNGTTITLYAQWEIIPYTITYNLGSHDAVNAEENPSSYDVTTAVTLQAPTRPFSTFQGWYTTSKFKTKATTIKKGSTGNKNFYAKWTTNKYTITFKGNGSTSGKMKDLTGIVYNADKTLTANAFKRTGYHFVEWNTAADGSGTSYANKQVVNGLSTENGVKIALYAIWEKDIYNITYVLNGSDAVNAAENPAIYDVENAITLTAPNREHYTFGGWYTDKKLKKKATTIKKGSTGNKTFYAKWTPNKYTIAYNGNGATSGKMKNTTGVAYGSSKKLTSNSYSRKGYKFIGWNTAADGSGTSYANKASVRNLAEDNGATVILYAQWEIQPAKTYSRDTIIEKARSYLGVTEGSARHKEIINRYNAKKPLPRGYAVKYTDAWCAAYVSAIAIMCGYTDIIPTECGCPQMITLARKMGIWQESDAYRPQKGDIILYDWQDSGSGDNTGIPDHIGFVESVSGNQMTIIEGNYNSRVKERTVTINGKNIRGFITPKYTAETDDN